MRNRSFPQYNYSKYHLRGGDDGDDSGDSDEYRSVFDKVNNVSLRTLSLIGIIFSLIMIIVCSVFIGKNVTQKASADPSQYSAYNSAIALYTCILIGGIILLMASLYGIYKFVKENK